MKQNTPSRFQASVLHLLITLTIVTIAAGSFILYFFPTPFYQADNAGNALLILSATALLAGPPLTALVYRPGKRGLKLDLTLVALFQLLATGSGFWHIHQSRPAYLILHGDTFYLAGIQRIDQNKLRNKHLAVKPWSRPKIVIAQVPGSLPERLTRTVEYFNRGEPIQFNAEYWIDFTHAPIEDISDHALDINNLSKKYNENTATKLQAYNNPDNYSFFYTVSHIGLRIAIVDKRQRDIVTLLHPEPKQ